MLSQNYLKNHHCRWTKNTNTMRAYSWLTNAIALNISNKIVALPYRSPDLSTLDRIWRQGNYAFVEIHLKDSSKMQYDDGNETTNDTKSVLSTCIFRSEKNKCTRRSTASKSLTSVYETRSRRNEWGNIVMVLRRLSCVCRKSNKGGDGKRWDKVLVPFVCFN